MDRGRPYPHRLSLYLMWTLSLLLLLGFSACGPAPSDSLSHVESGVSPRGTSAVPYPPRERLSSRNDLTKSAKSVTPLASLRESVKTDPVPRPDRTVPSDQILASGDVLEQPGVLPLMNVWTMEGLPVSVVVFEDQPDDPNLEDDADNERRNWNLSHAMEPMEDEPESEDRADERNK